MICLIVEFGIMFTGRTLFNDKYNMIVIASHMLGLFLTLGFLAYTYHFAMAFVIVFLFGAAIPLVTEIASYTYSKMNYRNAYMV